jgi:hypothetical protein
MEPVWNILVWVVLPLWVGAGFADYLCHRASDIEHANGIRESLIHWLMLIEVVVPLGLCVFFRINAFVIAVALACLLAHEVTGYLDLKLAMATRRITAFEKQVHSVLEVLPLTAILLVMILHWPQTQALFGLGTEPAQWFLGPKQIPRWGEIVPPLTALVLLAIAPYAEELARGLKAPKKSCNK